jgi:hypothetical protein
VRADGRTRAKLPHEEADDGPPGELSSQSCEASAKTTSRPFDHPAADGVLKHTIHRAWSCGLHTMSHFDLSLHLNWGNAGCVARVSLDGEVPSNISECLLRRFEKATVPPFSGGSPVVQVRIINDRAWWDWL